MEDIWKDIVRIEVTFNDGRFVAFPKVYCRTIDEQENSMTFMHGDRNDLAFINKTNVNFIEWIHEPSKEE